MERYLTDRARTRRWWEIPVGVLSAFLGAVAIEVWTEDSPRGENFMIWLLAHLAVLALMLLPLRVVALSWLRRRHAAAVARRLAAWPGQAVPFDEMDRALHLRGSWRAVSSLLRHGYLQRVELVDGQLVKDGEEEEPEPSANDAAGTEDILGEIRRLNDAIDDEAVSRRIDQLEAATAGILSTVHARPERAAEARRFMNYYLPTTLKLLESYRLMEGQSYQGENITSARRRIEAILDKLVSAAREQQDKLFRSESLDVEAEIRVLETMMAADGFEPRQTP